MDKIKTRHLAWAALTLALTACTQDELADDNRLPEGEYPVVIRATGLSVEATPQAAPSTRATVDGDWQGVQTVALKMGDAVKEYTVTPNSADNTKATLSCENDPHYWTSRDPITVSAWWPLDKADITRMPAVKVAEVQSTLAAFQGSDFISAENQTVTFSDPKLTFTHRTARVAIELKPGTGFTSVDGATVSLVSLSTDNENPTAIKTYNASGNSYEALTAPQTVAKGEPFIQVELGGGNFYFRPQNDVVLEAGNRYTYTVRVNATGLTLEGCTIGDWADGGGENGEAGLSYIYDKETNTYTVYTADGLLAWNEAAQKDMTLNCTLADNITLPAVAEDESNWTPIGTESRPYTGTFDGGTYTITGLTVNQTRENVGLIGCIGSNGTVKNVKLENVNITGDGYFVGGVAGTNYGTIENCSVDGTLTNNRHYLGGVVGNNYGSIIGCSSSGTITGTSPNVGGIGGQSVGGTIMACYSVANIKGRSSSGGVLGQTNRETVVIACYHAKGNVTGEQSRMIGGVIGWNYGKVTACYWENNQ
ncbi:fimbrillin family protein, partial [Phocaeicola plebeius]|uniref:fimbrillin family protein n=1 Tax=Phocaeicola plebeius TaxID=310297 RepID=UPI0026ED5FC4